MQNTVCEKNPNKQKRLTYIIVLAVVVEEQGVSTQRSPKLATNLMTKKQKTVMSSAAPSHTIAIISFQAFHSWHHCAALKKVHTEPITA